LKMKWDDAKIISLHGRSIQGLVNRIQHYPKVALFTDEENGPQRISSYLKEYNEDTWRMHVLENLGGINEKVSSFDIDKVEGDFSSLNVICLERTSPFKAPAFKIHADEEFAKRMPKKGLITKKEVRALAISNLELRKNSIVWDIGAGSGSVSIESAKLAYEGKVYAIEVDPEGAQICAENAKAFKTDNIEVIHGRAPEVLCELSAPDAIFVGGTKGSMKETLQYCLERLRPEGRLVVSAITLDNVASAYQSFKELGYFPEVELIQVSRGKKLAHYLRYDALNPIHLFSVTKKEGTHE
ncbi:MAG: precorrin-6Y C5,15-methyltransferase (decarboxylating) subunit CbiT, partial [Bacteriovoracaceae bacterium]